MANSFFSITEIGNSIRGFFQGSDSFTRPLNIGNGVWFNARNLNTPQEVYETISNNEMKLFRTTPEIYIPIMKKATMFSNGVFRVKDYKTNEVIENHPLIKALEKPTLTMSRNEWMVANCVNIHLYGNSYMYKNQPNPLSNPFKVLFPILPNSEMVIKTTGKSYKMTEKNEIIESYKLQNNNDTFTTDEIIHIKTYSEDGIKGISPLEALQMPISNARASYGFNNVNQSKKGALGIISSNAKDEIGATNMADEDRLDLEKQFTEDYGIFDGQNPIKFSKAPINYQNLNYPIKDQMIFETINQAMQKVIDAIGLNENIFSRDKQSTFTNMNEGLKMAYQDSIIPFAELFCFALNDSLGLFDLGIYIELDYSHVPALQENQKDVATNAKVKSEALQGLVSIGYSIQEAEQLLGITQE